jgi:hypothetical protein
MQGERSLACNVNQSENLGFFMGDAQARRQATYGVAQKA